MYCPASAILVLLIHSSLRKELGRVSNLNQSRKNGLPFSQKIRKFRFGVKWKGNFPENLFGNYRQPPEVVLFFRSERNSRNALTICENPSVSRPFLTRSSKICGMECCVVNGNAILIRLVIKFGKSLTFMQRSFHPDYLA